MTHGSLFSGIGGFDLGFQWAGIETLWQVEIDPYCRKVLERHFPNAERFADIRDVGKHNLKPVDIISGGFPCQDISNAGKRAGIEGERSGLWSEMFRVVCELRPNFVLVENVAALSVRGARQVFGDLAAARFDAEWSVLSACAVGFPHTRERMFILAYSEGNRGMQRRRDECTQDGEAQRDVYLWPGESEPLRVADGIPERMDRKHAIGNAVVPQIAQFIGERILLAAR